MRPQLRFKTLLLLPVPIALALAVLVRSDWFATVTTASDAPIRLMFRIVDADSGLPIVGAFVLLDEPGHEEARPVLPHHFESFADGDGRVPLAVTLPVREDRNGATGQLLDRQVRYPAWSLFVGADGYRAYQAVLAGALRDLRFQRDREPPTILVRMHRELGPE